MTPLHGDRTGAAEPECERVSLALGEAGVPVAEALGAALRVDLHLHESAEAAREEWMRSEAVLPHVAFFAVGDPGLASAAELLRARADLPLLVGVYQKREVGAAVALLRTGFYDCLPGPLHGPEALALLRQCLEERRRFRAERNLGRSTLATLTALAGERDALRAGSCVADLLAGHGPQAVVVAGRAFPGGEEYAPPPELWAALAKQAPASVGGLLPAALAGATHAEAHLLAPGVLLLRAGTGTPAPRPEERLAGSVLALVLETGRLRQAIAAPPAPAAASAAADPALTSFLAATHKLGHDINNPLCALLLNAQLLGIELTGRVDPPALERIRAIEQHARRIEELVQALSAARRTAAASLIEA